MEIEVMKYEQLEELRYVDKMCFDRKELRSSTRIQELWEISQGYSFVGIENHKIIAYVFTHSYGKVATIGPIGVIEEKRLKGYGSSMIETAVSSLRKKGIQDIYIEVLPDKLKNIEFYLKSGFVFEFPTIQIDYKKCHEEKDISVAPGNSISKESLEIFLNTMEIRDQGFSYREDLLRVLEKDPCCCFFSVNEKGVIDGFLSYYQELYDFVFGYINSECNVKKIFNALFSALQDRFKEKKLMVRINTEQRELLSSIADDSDIVKILERMRYSGKKEMEEKDCIIRSYIG